MNIPLGKDTFMDNSFDKYYDYHNAYNYINTGRTDGGLELPFTFKEFQDNPEYCHEIIKSIGIYPVDFK
jgi:hypothetical protein